MLSGRGLQTASLTADSAAATSPACSRRTDWSSRSSASDTHRSMPSLLPAGWTRARMGQTLSRDVLYSLFSDRQRRSMKNEGCKKREFMQLNHIPLSYSGRGNRSVKLTSYFCQVLSCSLSFSHHMNTNLWPGSYNNFFFCPNHDVIVQNKLFERYTCMLCIPSMSQTSRL